MLTGRTEKSYVNVWLASMKLKKSSSEINWVQYVRHDPPHKWSAEGGCRDVSTTLGWPAYPAYSTSILVTVTDRCGPSS